MNIKHILTLISLFLAMFCSPAFADRLPKPGAADARVKTITYHENDVYSLRGHYGFTTVIEFSSKERIETISIGDSEAWQVIKPNRPNVLFIKPLEQNAETNMTVLTSKRVYTFDMSATTANSYKSNALTFRLKFVYPDETALELAHIGNTNAAAYEPVLSGSAESWNFDYSYSGSKRLRPQRVFDDGTFTYFQFNDFDVMPAVFSVDEQGNESIINFNIQGKYLVVNSVGRQFTLRDGDISTCIFNDAAPEIKSTQTAVVPIDVIEEKKLADIPIPRRKPGFALTNKQQAESSLFALLNLDVKHADVVSLNQ